MKFSIKNNLSCLLCLVAMLASFNCVAKNEKETPQKLSMREVFSNLKDQSLDLLPKSTRLDMLDYYEADSIYKARNVMDGLSELVKVTDDYLKVKISQVSNLQIKILPSKTYGNIVMTIYTVGAKESVSDSEVSFFDNNLKKLKRNEFLELPQLKDFFSFPKGSLTKMKDIEEIVPFPTFEYFADPANTNLGVKLTVGGAMNMEDAKIVNLFLKPSIIYEWNGQKYKLKK